MIEVRCPQCDHLLRAGDRFAGKNVGCKYCGAVFVAPSPNAPNPPMPIRGESTFLPEGPPPVPTPMPMVDDSPPGPDYASPQYPTPPAVPSHRAPASPLIPIIIVVVLWAVAVAVVYWRVMNPMGSAKAETPEAALRVLVRGLGDDSVEVMRSATRYHDREWADTLLRLMAANHDLERAFEQAGQEAPVSIALPWGWSVPPAHQLHPDDYKVDVQGNSATIAFSGPLSPYEDIELVKNGPYWYVDLRDYEPHAFERAFAQEAASAWQGIIREARNEVDSGQTSPKRVEQALFAYGSDNMPADEQFLAEFEGAISQPLATTTPAAPLEPGDPIYGAMHEVLGAIHRGDMQRLQGLVAPDSVVAYAGGGERAFWDVYTPEVLQSMTAGAPPDIAAIVPVDRGLSETTVRVTTSSEFGEANTRYTFRNQAGYWLLTRIAPESY